MIRSTLLLLLASCVTACTDAGLTDLGSSDLIGDVVDAGVAFPGSLDHGFLVLDDVRSGCTHRVRVPHSAEVLDRSGPTSRSRIAKGAVVEVWTVEAAICGTEAEALRIRTASRAQRGS